MSWAIGYDRVWKRDIGYGVPALCDHPRCNAHINRGLSHVCGGEPYGGERGCGLYFCGLHLGNGSKQLCSKCRRSRPPFTPKPDVEEWIKHKLMDESWKQWREENPKEVEEMLKSQGFLDLPQPERAKEI